jgi:hypothetical protein
MHAIQSHHLTSLRPSSAVLGSAENLLWLLIDGLFFNGVHRYFFLDEFGQIVLIQIQKRKRKIMNMTPWEKKLSWTWFFFSQTPTLWLETHKVSFREPIPMGSVRKCGFQWVLENFKDLRSLRNTNPLNL